MQHISLYCLKSRAMGRKHKFFHGTLEATIFHATPYTPSFPFNVSTNYWQKQADTMLKKPEKRKQIIE